ncbi:heme exporter protein CcmD [Hyphomonas sp. WL0036]|uniref:heme exporter protein CcmD n=1 Tax=Hyphomonas sediminis TaxID=2866160 RepID=UPI001C812372|nr:heme exporter protein CcmD [Hyphomonas sediminis]MBY9065886.1 heme exporter protein CcmD [Hyphomonas sediminis]
MPEFDKNAAYIWACYLIGALMIGAACLQAWLAAKAAKRRLDRLAANDDEASA